jgi:osmotically-inducible protein OsmY
MKRNLFAAALASLVIGSVSGMALADDEGVTAKAGKAIDDAAVVASVKSKLLSSPDVEGLDVNVDAKNGVVTLSGTADTMAERSSAEKIAKSADGVKSVSNRIEVKADAPVQVSPPKPAQPVPATPPATN